MVTRKTDPVPRCVQVTLPAGEWPVTLALQVMVLDEGTIVWLQETASASTQKVAEDATFLVEGSLTTTNPVLPLMRNDVMLGMLPEESVVNSIREEQVLGEVVRFDSKQ